MAHAGALVCRVDDVVDTGEGGHHFVKLNTGITLRVRSNWWLSTFLLLELVSWSRIAPLTL